MSSAVRTPTRRGSRWVPPPPGRNTDQHLRQTDLCRGNRDAVVACHRVLQTAAEGVPVDRRHHRLMTGVQHVIGAFADRRTFAASAEAADVSARDKTAAVPISTIALMHGSALA